MATLTSGTCLPRRLKLHGGIRSRKGSVNVFCTMLFDESGDGIVGIRFDPDSPLLRDTGSAGKAVVCSLVSGSPAAKAGLEPLDEILAINNVSVRSRQDAIARFRKASWPIQLRVCRSLTAKCNELLPVHDRHVYEQLAVEVEVKPGAECIGITFDSRPGSVAEAEPIVHSIVGGSAAAAAGLQALDLLLAVNGTKLTSTAHAMKVLRAAKWPIRIAFGRPQSLQHAARVLQRAWRAAIGVTKVSYKLVSDPSKCAPYIEFAEDVIVAPLIHAHCTALRAAGLRNGMVVLNINGELCCSREHAERLIREATDRVELLCKKAEHVNRAWLRDMSRDAACCECSARCSTDECTICLQPMECTKPWPAGCGHVFCGGCTERCVAISDACPLCRRTPKAASAALQMLRQHS
uniref:RING-type E3 ubiquitin transferase n=1 Tax=Chrysotila carterae TaxID=13221 RepID=A0A7S4C4R8_CHRCT|mmetsp:Transcript_11424/g.24425  ORF Transcript_11424/g.24425 Transcript_11424/m.24425 type:complete len:407 (-) Transcript_11424:622-1842(-)|eukprot:6204895-Pleurochrysis_carterae.AAC.5